MKDSCACCTSTADTRPSHDGAHDISDLMTGEGHFTPELPACSFCSEDRYPGSNGHSNEGASLFRFFSATPSTFPS